MASIAAHTLRILHYIYALNFFIYSCWKRFAWSTPQFLTTTRRRVPKHLALLLVADPETALDVSEDFITRSIIDTVGWCRAIGIDKLTVYEEHGTLLKYTQHFSDYFSSHSSDGPSSQPEVEYPLTPPPSDYSESRPISPQDGFLPDLNTTTIYITGEKISQKLNAYTNGPKMVHRHNNTSNPLTLCLASRRSSKPAIASVARWFASKQNYKYRKGTRNHRNEPLTADILDSYLEGDHSLSSPDFMILHNPLHYKTPLELYGFPPWHIRLTEIYHDRFQTSPAFGCSNSPLKLVPLNELSFRRALDEFATAEMRFGK